MSIQTPERIEDRISTGGIKHFIAWRRTASHFRVHGCAPPAPQSWGVNASPSHRLPCQAQRYQRLAPPGPPILTLTQIG